GSAFGNQRVRKIRSLIIDKEKRAGDHVVTFDLDTSDLHDLPDGGATIAAIEPVLAAQRPIQLQQTHERYQTQILPVQPFAKRGDRLALRRVVVDDQPYEDIRIDAEALHAASLLGDDRSGPAAASPPARITAASISSS